MFKSKKFLFIFIAQTAMPWVVAFSGAFAIHFFNAMGQLYRAKIMDEYEHASKMCETIYRGTMLYGIALMFLLFILGVVSFVIMLVRIFRKNKEDQYSVVRPLVIWLYSGGCILGTLVLMLLVIAFTYGQSV